MAPPRVSTQTMKKIVREEALQRVSDSGRALSDAVVRFHAKAAEGFGMGASDWKALGFISQNGPISHRELVRFLGLKPASVTNILDRLQSAGWVIRTKSTEDARSIQITANENKLGEFRGKVFGPLMKRLGEVYSQYSVDELNLIAEAFSRIAEAQNAAAEDLSGS